MFTNRIRVIQAFVEKRKKKDSNILKGSGERKEGCLLTNYNNSTHLFFN